MCRDILRQSRLKQSLVPGKDDLVKGSQLRHAQQVAGGLDGHGRRRRGRGRVSGRRRRGHRRAERGRPRWLRAAQAGAGRCGRGACRQEGLAKQHGQVCVWGGWVGRGGPGKPKSGGCPSNPTPSTTTHLHSSLLPARPPRLSTTCRPRLSYHRPPGPLHGLAGRALVGRGWRRGKRHSKRAVVQGGSVSPALCLGKLARAGQEQHGHDRGRPPTTIISYPHRDLATRYTHRHAHVARPRRRSWSPPIPDLSRRVGRSDRGADRRGPLVRPGAQGVGRLFRARGCAGQGQGCVPLPATAIDAPARPCKHGG